LGAFAALYHACELGNCGFWAKEISRLWNADYIATAIEKKPVVFFLS
jgi:hypothetical protein